MESRQRLHSAAVIRILETIGVFSKEIPIPINSKKFELKNDKQKIWGGKVNIDESSWILLLYSEIEGVKYLVTKPMGDLGSSVLWYFVVCGDDSGEEYINNKIFAEVSFKTVDSVSGKEIIKVETIEISCFDLCNFLRGFEIIRNYVGYILPIEPEEEFINKVVEFGGKLSLEEEVDA